MIMAKERFEGLDEVDKEFETIIPDESGDRSVETIDAENFMDEVSADLIKERAEARHKAKEEVDIAGLWGTLDRKTLQTLQETDLLTKDSIVSGNETLYLDDIDHVPKDRKGKATRTYCVPDHIKLWWVSKHLRSRIGYRQWRPIKRTEKTELWAPNAQQFGTKKTIEASGYVLMGMERAVWLRRKFAELKRVSIKTLQEQSEEYKSAVSNARQRLGMSRSQATKLDRSEASGFNVIKVALRDRHIGASNG
jgi:hypothetical protein